MSYETLLYEVSEHVATITFNRPEKMNTWNAQVASELSEAMLKANTDDEVRAIVLTGAGRAFCAGADLERGGDTFSNRDESGGRQSDEGRNTRNVYPNEIDKPVIAAINGAGAGAGVGWAFAFDLRYATARASFNTAFLGVAISGDMGGPWTLPRIVGAQRARELFFMSEKFKADVAEELGVQ